MKYRILKECVSPFNIQMLCPGEVYDWNVAKYDGVAKVMFTAMVLNGFVEEVKDEPWRPKVGEKYWYLDSFGNVVCDTITQMIGDEFTSHLEMVRRKDEIGNRFETAEQAKKAAEWLKAFKVLRDDTKGEKIDWDTPKSEAWYVYYDHLHNRIAADAWACWEMGPISFATEADAEESIKKHEKEWRQFLGKKN